MAALTSAGCANTALAIARALAVSTNAAMLPLLPCRLPVRALVAPPGSPSGLSSLLVASVSSEQNSTASTKCLSQA
jgi:uncharacterized protein (DUF2062 family)